ncbi:amino acid adenylation domain protein [Crinalium epipsammum PCC 9333]|uniref:Amino acid adenylation domain protein n=1 Tax=Crinalium epipsammum PCC 9333 TaxID=1173022 RepID=K9VUV8_9CYAN|nr:non-ribosomal peptide synthetase [Crinalium epipsammum]AFZ11267.1 amino acid adenylation domain protein [Crinalium epipsammum PCC 9333]
MSKKNIEDFYPLSPMQQGMLFHSIYAPNSGVYFEQLSCTLNGNLNLELFKQTWQQVIDRHPILRTAFIWEGVKEAVQVVHRQIQLPWQQFDWKDLSATEQQQELENFLQAEEESGFQLNKAPLTRLTLIQVAKDSYYFIWSHHHLLLDGWSTPLLLQEVFTTYSALCKGEQISLPRPRPYRDYIVWLQQQKLGEAECFWREKLKNFTAPTPLSVEMSVGSGGEKYDAQQIQLSATATSALQALTRQNQLTLNTLVQGAWALLLSRYSGEKDIVFGTTVSGRPPTLLGADAMMGLFINTLPVRVGVQGEDALIPWLQQLQAQQTEARQYEYTPLLEIQGWSEVPRGVPLFESLLVFENYPLESSLQQPIANLEIQNVRMFEKTNYPLTVIAVPDSELLLKIAYDTRRFDAATITRMLGHIQTLLEGIAVNPHQCLDKLPLLTDAERHQLLIEWNATETDYPKICIHQLFEAQVEKTPNAVAAVFEDQQLTYQELNIRANQVANYLQSLGVQPDSLVAICVERSLEMLVALLGILKSGAAYLPLDPAYPQERLAFMLEDAQVSVLLTQQDIVETLDAKSLRKSHIKLVCIDRDWEMIFQSSQQQPMSQVNSNNLAYVIYTSGSTGKPKGVQICHASAVNFLCSMHQQLEINETDVLLAVTSLSFDIAGLELFLPVTSGSCVVIASREVAIDGNKLIAKIHESSATIMQATPATWRMLLTAGWQGNQKLKILCGGEALPQQLANELLNKSACLWNLYGPTETTIWSTIYQVKEPNNLVFIGRPIANTQIYLLDRNLQPVPVGVAGELYIGGAGLSRGYLNRPELTTERFIANPFIEGNSIYQTGDLARYLPDGNIEYFGRIDDQVKVRGFRIELGEIEAIISQYPLVQQAVIVAKEDNSGDKYLAAYIIPHVASPENTISSELRNWLQDKLPSYMIPSSFVVLEKLPLTPNGKIDRKALPAPDNAISELGRGLVTPRTQTEEIVSSIWAQILGLKQVGIYDNFFELGGHSLIATKVISRLREAFQIEIPLSWLFESPTVAALTQRIQTEIKGKKQLEIPPLAVVPRTENSPLSFSQQRLWFLQQLTSNSPEYNISSAVKLTGSLNIAALERSLSEIIRRHEALRTRFVDVDGQPVQVIEKMPTGYQACVGRLSSYSPTLQGVGLPVIDLSDIPASEREDKARWLAKQDAEQFFDLTKCPLLRFSLVRLDAQSHIFILTMHHIISDAWSLGVFLEELATLYKVFASKDVADNFSTILPELPIQYADFAIWQRQWLQGDVLQTQLDYWKQQLGQNCLPLEFPNSRSRSTVPSNQGAKLSFVLPKDLTEAIAQLSRQSGVTLFMTLLAAYQTLLYCYTGQEDIRIGSPIVNRNQVELEKLIGFLINTLVLRGDLSGNPSFKELLVRSRQVTLGAYAHQDLPFDKLVEALQPERKIGQTSLYHAWFVLQNTPTPPLELAGLTMSLLDIETTTARHDLLLNVFEITEGLHCTFEYKTDLFNQATIARIAQSFQTLLHHVVAQPNSKLSELATIIAETDKQQQLSQEQEMQTANIQKLKSIKRKAIHS